MKLAALLAPLAFATTAIGGVNTVETYRVETGTCEGYSARGRESVLPGTYHYSNFCRNAVYMVNETSDFVTFFVYFGSVPGINDVDKMVRSQATVYEMIVPPQSRRFLEQRGPQSWICAKPGKWAVDRAAARVVSAE